ncbi:MAG: glyoxalase/bleomycin resistance/dioxygenase family protein [Massilimaliae sp.]|nr:glyoxalase/bleomycin resistance/dioxygenase family protein [Massiliimalia sp.]
MKLKMPVLAVRDIKRSTAFYRELFDQKVIMDLGKNVTLSGGLALQEDFAWLVGIPEQSVAEKSNNMELYYEVEDFEAFMEKLGQHPEIERVHPPKQYEWKQRVVRVYDPDGHMIEIGESMEAIAKRYLKEGYSVEETAEMIQHPVTFVSRCAKRL